MEEKKRIRFIDSHYHTLFSIADGDSIEIVYPDGKREERVCTYIDEYHTQVGAREMCIRDRTKMVFMGGGSSIVEHFGANEGKDVQFVTDIHANARGCEEAVKSIIRAKQRKMRTA